MDTRPRSLIDHVIVASRDLEDASHRWQALGFNLSDPGAHPTRGTVNRCIPFPNAYVELLAPNPAGCEEAFLLRTLARREGGTSIALAMQSSEAVHRTLAGFMPAIEPPITGSRDILSAKGRERISFDVQRLPEDALWPGRFFFCGHHHVDKVYQTELFEHPNGVTRLESVVHLVPSVPTVWPPMIEALGFRLLGQDAESMRIDCGGVELILSSRAALPRFMPTDLMHGLPDTAAPVMLGFACRSERWVSAPEANGIVLHFRAR